MQGRHRRISTCSFTGDLAVVLRLLLEEAEHCDAPIGQLCGGDAVFACEPLDAAYGLVALSSTRTYVFCGPLLATRNDQ